MKINSPKTGSKQLRWAKDNCTPTHEVDLIQIVWTRLLKKKSTIKQTKQLENPNWVGNEKKLQQKFLITREKFWFNMEYKSDHW